MHLKELLKKCEIEYRKQHFYNGSVLIKEIVNELDTYISQLQSEEEKPLIALIVAKIVAALERHDYVFLADLSYLLFEVIEGRDIDTNLLSEEYGIGSFNSLGQIIHLKSTISPTQEAIYLVDDWDDNSIEYFVFGDSIDEIIFELNRRNLEKVIHVCSSSNDIDSFLLEYKEREALGARLLVHYPTLRLLDDSSEKRVLEDYFINFESIKELSPILDCNFKKISSYKFNSIKELSPLIEHKTCIAIGGGPSLDEEINELKKLQDQCTIISTGRATKRIMSEGITPDIIVVCEPKPEAVDWQVTGSEFENIPLVLLSTASGNIPDFYAGPIYLAYQEGYSDAEKKAQKDNEPIFETGGSVSTLALDLCRKFNSKKIIIIGMDMAFTKGQRYSNGAENNGIKLGFEEMRSVMSVDGQLIQTSYTLDIYRKWIERWIERNNITNIFNISLGAHINGTIECTLDEAFRCSVES